MTVNGIVPCHRNTKKEGNILINDALNTFIYGYMIKDIWLRTRQIMKVEITPSD